MPTAVSRRGTFLYSINLKTALCACKAALSHLPPDHGRIINVGAAATAKAGTGMGAYTASKAGVAKLTEALAEELKDKGINVNAVLPTIIDTPANRADMPKADFTRWVDPQALADVIVFLSSQCSPRDHRRLDSGIRQSLSSQRAARARYA